MTRDDASPFEVRVKTTLVVLGTFLFGAFTGIGFYRWAAPPRRHMPPFMGGPFRELDLTRAQQERARQIFDSHRAELDAIMRETYPRVRAIHEQIETEMRATLTPEQQKKLDEIKARRPHGMPPGGGFGPPPGGGFGPPPGGFGPPPGFFPGPPPGMPPDERPEPPPPASPGERTK